MITQQRFTDGSEGQSPYGPGGGGAAGSNPSFSQLQTQGAPRPPAPAYSGATAPPSAAPRPYPGTAAVQPPPAPTPVMPVASSTAAPGAPGAAGAPSASSYEDTLRTNAVTAAQAAGAPFNPSAALGANPFQTPTAPTYTPNAGAQSAQSALLARVMQMVGNPNPYSADAMKTAYADQGQAIDDQFKQTNQSILEEMARRGVSSSSMYGGRLQDSAAMQKTAKSTLADNLLQHQADTESSSALNAINAARGVLGDTQAAGTQDFNNLVTSTSLADSLRRGSYQDYLSGFQAQQGASQNATNQLETASNDSFNHQYQTAELNSLNDARLQQLILQMAGIN